MGVFEQACIMSNESFLKTIPDVLPEPQYSQKHIRKMNRLINKMRNDRYHRLTTGTVKVLVVAAIILSLALSAFAIPSVREYVITQFKTHSVFRAVSTEDSKPVTDLTVGYIPEGFDMTKEDKNEWGYTCTLSNENNDWIVISKVTKGAEINIDTQTSGYEVNLNNGKEYIIFESDDEVGGLVWFTEIYTYTISSNIEKEKLFQIAENIQ